MDAHRNLAIAKMAQLNAESAGDFMHQAKIPMPEPIVPGALPAMARETVPAQMLNLFVDVAMVWTIGDYAPGLDCSLYYDPQSAWYNVIYGAYGLRSYKRDGSAWGFHPNGTPNFSEFFEISKIDYCFLTAAQFGCPPDKLAVFEMKQVVPGGVKGWATANVAATIPSGLHDLETSLGVPESYVIYGVPSPSYLTGGHTAFEPVAMRGVLYMKQMTPGPQPITLAWGAVCPDTHDGGVLLDQILGVLGQAYFGI